MIENMSFQARPDQGGNFNTQLLQQQPTYVRYNEQIRQPSQTHTIEERLGMCEILARYIGHRGIRKASPLSLVYSVCESLFLKEQAAEATTPNFLSETRLAFELCQGLSLGRSK